jgi:hypothetical protein
MHIYTGKGGESKLSPRTTTTPPPARVVVEEVEVRSHLRGLALGRLLKEARLRSVDRFDPLGIGHENFREGGVHICTLMTMMREVERSVEEWGDWEGD